MKKTKVIIPALGILLLSTAASVTGTVAWFSMTDTVTASGMLVQAKAEQGIVIANSTKAEYLASVNASDSDVHALKPASTSDLVNWFHSLSTNAGQANTQQKYDAITSAQASTYYVSHQFYIRSSTGTALNNSKLVIDNVELNDATHQTLTNAIRVGITFKEQGASDYQGVYIFAPAYDEALNYNVTTAAGAYAAANMVQVTAQPTAQEVESSVDEIPNNQATGVEAKVFIWFEGEDASCISNNISASLEELTVTVSFSYATPQD